MVQLEKLLDAWRADPRVESTVELGNMLLRANVKAKGALPRPFIIAFGDEASRAHPKQMEVLEILSRLFAVSGEGSRATALYARSALLYPGDPRVGALETALRGDGLAVPPPDAAAKQATAVPEPEAPVARKIEIPGRRSELPPKKVDAPPPKKELAAPRPLQTSLADFMPPIAGKELPIDPGGAFPIDMEPSTSTGIHTDPTRDAPPHVPEVPTTQLTVSGVDAALGEDAAIPKRARAPTIGGLGLPAPPLPAGASTTPALGAPPAAPARASSGSAAVPVHRPAGAPAARVRPQTQMQRSGTAGPGAMGSIGAGAVGDPGATSARPPETAIAPTVPGPVRRSHTLVGEPGVAPPAMVPPARVKDLAPIDPADPVRMFTPVRAFTPPPGNLAWGPGGAAPPEPPEETRSGDDTTQGGDATTNIIQASARAAAGMMIDSPTTTQETITKPNPLGPSISAVRGPAPSPSLGPSSGEPPPTQTRLVPQEDQLRAAAASIIARPLGAPMEGVSGAPRPAARRAGSSPRSPLRFDADEDPPTGVTSTETQVTAPPAPTPGIPEIPDLGLDMAEADGQATARRDTSELLAAALLPRAPNGSPALGAPTASTPPPAPPAPPAIVPAANVKATIAGTGPTAVPVLGPPPALPPPSTVMPAPVAPRPPATAAPMPPGPIAKPTLVSRTPGPGGPAAKPTLVSSGAKSPSRPVAAPAGPVGPPSSGAFSPPRAPEPTGLDTADETSTAVRPAGPSQLPPANVGAPSFGPRLPPPPPMATPPAAPARPAAESSTMSRAITDLWEPRDKSGGSFDPRREPDEDGPSTNVFNPPAQVQQVALAAAAHGAHPSPQALVGLTPPVRGIPIVDDPSFAEEISSDSIETIDDASGGADVEPPTGRAEAPRGKPRSTQKIAGTVAPAVVWSPPTQDEPAETGVRTRVLTAEQSAAAGRVDPLPSSPSSQNDWVITPPPPVAPRFGAPPPSVRPSIPPGQLQGPMPGQMPGPMSVPPHAMPPSVPVPSYAPPAPGSMRPRPFEADPGRPPMPRQGKGSPSPILVGSVIGIALSVLVAGGVWLYGLASETKSTNTTTNDATATDVDAIVFGGRKEDLDRADGILAGAVPAGREKAYALARARERALRALELGTTDKLTDALANARRVGVTEEELAFLELAKAVADRDNQAEKALLAKWADRRKSDAFFLLTAGVSLEQRGDRAAVENYGAALGAEPRLRPAALRLARAELLDGDSTRGVARVEGLAAQGAQAPEVLALRGLVWLRSRDDAANKGKPAPSVPAEASLPVELRFIPSAVALVGSTDAAKRRAALEEAAQKADTPSVEVLFGTIAFDLKAEASALEIARAALRRTPEHAPSIALFARSGLALAKLDTLDEVGKSLPTAQQKLLRAITAYERGDVATVVEVRTWLGQRDEPGREGIVARAERLVGTKPMPPARVQALQRADVAGGDLVAVDALLDAGDMAAARAVVDKWGDPSSHPLRALRAARLLRYEGKSSEAESALDVAAPTQPALVERVLIEADKADERAHARSMLDARFGEDRFYYEAYLLALDDKMPAAQKLLDGLPVPGDDAPLARRVAAALAFGAVDDKDRGRELVRRLASTWPRNPDVERARRAIESRRR